MSADHEQSPTKPRQHRGLVNSAQFSPDGRRILTASGDTAQLWYVQSGQPLMEPLKHDDKMNSTQFSPDGKRIVTVSGDTARVWDVQSGQPLTGPLQHGGSVNSAQFSPDGKWIVTASRDKTARVWDAQSGQPLTEPLMHGTNVDSAQFSPDGTRILTVSRNTARVWDVAPSPENAPVWLPELAEAISGLILNKQGVLEPTRLNRTEIINQLRQESKHDPDDDGWVTWERWFLADPATRTISPFSKRTVRENQESRIERRTGNK